LIQGCATALVTPFKANGELDETGLRELVSLQEKAGIDYIVPCGTTGESATMT
jgi:4-hydroxy-tetrahydrodipicolinate synthase